MINEVVYADRTKINDKKKTIGLTYSKGNRANNNANPFDKLGTNEMDQDNANTIEVPLKGGLISYNITDIKGTEIMHYFKKRWAQRQRVSIDVKHSNGSNDSYDLEMDTKEEREFLDRFVKKVEMIINAWISKHKKEDVAFSKISILPVASTSNFNKVFVKKELQHLNIAGLVCQVVNPEMIVKDAKNIERDEEFINKNKQFYDSNFIVDKPEFGTINQRVNDIISKNKSLNFVNDKIQQINTITQKLLNFLMNNKKIEELSALQIKNLTYYYKLYVDLIRECYSVSYAATVDGKQHKLSHEQILQMIKYSKGPSIDKRSSVLWNMVKPYIRGTKSSIDGKPYTEMPLCLWRKSDFEIKNLRNSERLGLKNIYNVNSNWSEKEVQEELNKIKGTILLIFDDNISGGATLSDVCLQCQNLGLTNIIPITFGKMNETNTMKGLALNTPENGYNFSTNSSLSMYTGDKQMKRQYTKKDDALNKGRELFYKVYPQIVDNEILNILWLDDLREPYSYFSKPQKTIDWIKNKEYFENNIFKQYQPNFIWAKNMKEFQDYILNNSLPDMVSFDNDIAARNYSGKRETGEEIAQWLIKYCQQSGLKLPWTYVHSANTEGGQRIINVLNNNLKENKNIVKLTENDLTNMVKTILKQILSE